MVFFMFCLISLLFQGTEKRRETGSPALGLTHLPGTAGLEGDRRELYCSTWRCSLAMMERQKTVTRGKVGTALPKSLYHRHYRISVAQPDSCRFSGWNSVYNTYVMCLSIPYHSSFPSVTPRKPVPSFSQMVPYLVSDRTSD